MSVMFDPCHGQMSVLLGRKTDSLAHAYICQTTCSNRVLSLFLPFFQVLAYNHALLALWGSDSLVLVADVDEYLITHKPMTVVEVRAV